MGRKSSEEKRNHIRHSAYLCFREKGYHQTSIDDICLSAEISKGSFYWHYGAKIDVYIDILDNWAREVVDELLIQFDSAAKNPNRIQFLSAAFEQEFHRARAIVPLWAEFSLLARTDSEIQLSIGKFYRRARAAISEILRETTSGKLSESEISAASGMILGAYMGVVLQEYADSSINVSQWARDFVGILRFVFGQVQVQTEIPESSSVISGQTPENSGVYPIVMTDEIQNILDALRTEILLVRPDVSETWIAGWGAIGFYTKRLMCFVKVKEGKLILQLKKNIVPNLSEKSMNLLGGDNKINIESSEISPEIKMLLLNIFQN